MNVRSILSNNNMTTPLKNILSPHFEGEDLENLLKIIGIMQAPDSFEFGILQLHTLKLYDPLISFLKTYVRKWNFYMDYPQLIERTCKDFYMLEYMFATDIYFDYDVVETEWCCESVIPNRREIKGRGKYMILPIFAKWVEQITIISTTQDNYGFFGNMLDIGYDFQRVVCNNMGVLEHLPPNIRKLTVGGIQDVIEQEHLPADLEELSLHSYCKLKDDSIQHLNNLHTIVLGGYSLTLKYPSNIKNITLHNFSTYDISIEELSHIVANNPNLEQLKFTGLVNLEVEFDDTMKYLQNNGFEYKGGSLFERGLDFTSQINQF